MCQGICLSRRLELCSEPSGGPQIRALCWGCAHVWVLLAGLWKPASRGAREDARAKEAAEPGRRQSWDRRGQCQELVFQAEILLHAHSSLDASPLGHCRYTPTLRHTHASLPLVITFVDMHTLVTASKICHTHTDVLSTASRPSAMPTPSAHSGALRAHRHTQTDVGGAHGLVHTPTWQS